MRVVAGEFRGRVIDAPPGDGTRPTTDRVREALFSSLYSQLGGFEGVTVIDAFAGSGALGIEALSRGAQSAVFCERDARAARVLEGNVRSCGLDDRARIVRGDVLANRPAGTFDLVLLDPPYDYDPTEVAGLARDVAAPDAVVAYEHALKKRDEVAAALEEAGIQVVAQKKYGKTGVCIGRVPAEGDER